MSQPKFRLTEEFVELAHATLAASHKLVSVQATFHMPDNPHILQVFEMQMYDRLKTGVDDLMLIRAALDNPQHAQAMLRHLNKVGLKDIAPEQLGFIEQKVAKAFKGQDKDDNAAQNAVDRLKERTETALATRLRFAVNTDFNVRLNFKNAAADRMNLEFAPETRYFERLKPFLQHWIDKMEGPLHTVDLEVRPLVSTQELAEAAKHVDDAAARRGAHAHSQVLVGSKSDRSLIRTLN
jgi:uncharacterized protein Usg